jgi:predicted short-subunit dehydrogenase-like oxidoreductase (DUF2520 family)
MKNEVQKSFLPLLIGSGRLARHLGHYLSLKGIPHLHWAHPRAPLPDSLARNATHFWVLLSDQALVPYCEGLQESYPSTPVIHSSAATSIPGTLTAHPLMTFGPSLYSLTEYESIPFFMIKEEASPVAEVIHFLRETLKHPVHLISAEDRHRYHASAVMMSNYSIILWNAAFTAAKLNPEIPRRAFEPILKQTLNNFMNAGIDALTGPLKRNDTATIASHLKALNGTPETELYQAFVHYFRSPIYEPEKGRIQP